MNVTTFVKQVLVARLPDLLVKVDREVVGSNPVLVVIFFGGLALHELNIIFLQLFLFLFLSLVAFSKSSFCSPQAILGKKCHLICQLLCVKFDKDTKKFNFVTR